MDSVEVENWNQICYGYMKLKFFKECEIYLTRMPAIGRAYKPNGGRSQVIRPDARLMVGVGDSMLYMYSSLFSSTYAPHCAALPGKHVLR